MLTICRPLKRASENKNNLAQGWRAPRLPLATFCHAFSVMNLSTRQDRCYAEKNS